jgi:phenylpropionate dioxygenase-like ring-hydroxylating dioxygenase large terminal subunit
MSRYPFPIPFGWYQVGYPSDVEPGQARPLHYFGRDLVIWRDEDGGIHVNDAYCPHLGAHLGHGGSVHGCEIQCPFHGWRFDPEGNNTDIPYSERTNKLAHLRAYPTIERNGILMAWYHPDGAEPLWEIPEVPELNDPENFTEMVHRDFIVKAAWQELAENGVDSAHFRYVHNTDITPTLDSYETDGPVAKMRSTQKFPTPRGVVDGRIDADTYGPGFGVVRFSGIVDTVNLGCNTPIDAETCHLRFNFSVRRLGDAATTSTVGDAFVDEVCKQVQEDIPIWENKAYIPKPALADQDGPFMKFRKWASQFYAGEVTVDLPVYPAPAPDSPQPEPQGTTKQTASARIKGEEVVAR